MKYEINKNIKHNIKMLRIRNNLSMDELAKKMFVSKYTAYKWEKR